MIQSAKNNRRSIRLKDFDYSQNGAYFVTICVDNMECLFGRVNNEEVNLSKVGSKAKEFWNNIPEHFSNVIIDEYVIMPNHIHGILVIKNNEKQVVEDGFNKVGVQYIDPPQQQGIKPLQQQGIESLRKHKYQKTLPGSISTIIRSYKAAITRWTNVNGLKFKWQKNFYERIIRDEEELNNIREYIKYNPVKWSNKMENNQVENLYKI